MQEHVLEKHPAARLRVYAVWTNKLFLDSRGQWDAAGLVDLRVVHLWDQADLTGEWLVHGVSGFEGGDWDSYALFGPDATWGGSSPPALSSGATIIGRGNELQGAVEAALGM